MPSLTTAFVSYIYRYELGNAHGLLQDLERACRTIAAGDHAGRRWAADKAYPGYTSYPPIHHARSERIAVSFNDRWN